MDTSTLIGVLMFGTMGSVAVFAYLSVQKTEERRQSNKPKSTLAVDAPSSTPPGVKPPDV